MYNQQNNGITTPGELAWNGYFRVRNQWPNGITASGEFETKYIYGPGYPRTSINLIAFSGGYLSGSRLTLASRAISNGSSGAIYCSGSYNSTYPHIVVNMSSWMSQAGTCQTEFWEASAQ